MSGMRLMGSMRLLTVVGLMTAGGSALAAEPYGGGSMAPSVARPVVADSQIVADIQAKLQGNKLVRNAQVVVASKDGEMTLSGMLPSSFARDQILDAVRSTPGVVKYNDQMQLDVASPQAPTRY